MFPLSESGMSRNFWGRIKGAKYRFALQDGTWVLRRAEVETETEECLTELFKHLDPALPDAKSTSLLSVL